MEGYRKTVGLVANELNQMQDRRMVIKHDRIIFLPVDVDDFLALGDRGQRLVDNFQSLERFGRGVELAESAIDQNETWQRLLLFAEPLVAARDHFAHGCKVVHAL